MSPKAAPPDQPVHRGRSGKKLKIRAAGMRDIDALVSLSGHVQSLHAAAHPSLFRSRPPADEVAEAFGKMLENPGGVWLVAEDEAMCGCLYAQFHDRQENWCRPAFRFCNISHIVVHPDARRKGVARRLIDAIIEEAEKRGVQRIELEVWSFNQPAREVFRRLGFQMLSERMELTRPSKATLTQPASKASRRRSHGSPRS